MEKAPQIGFSWTCAAEATWEALLFEHATSSFVSVDQREASWKIRYARELYAGLPDIVQTWVPLTIDNRDELGFGPQHSAGTLLSIPATAALRGRPTNVYMDEADFYKDGGADTLRVSMGRISRGRRRLTIGSTCFGDGTVLAQIMHGDATLRRRFSKSRYPWVVATDPEIVESIVLAFDVLLEPDFAEEFECVRGGGVGQSFPASLLRAADHGREPWGLIEEVEPSGELCMGVDVGAGAHPSIFSLLRADGRGNWEQVALIELRGVTLPRQEEMLRTLMRKVRSLRVVIDANGIGLGPAQGLQADFSDRVQLLFPGSRGFERYDLAIELKRSLEDGSVSIAPDREQKEQLKRTRLDAGQVIQPKQRRKDHYDRFWALAYAVNGCKRRRTSIYEERGLIVVGG